MGNGKLVYGSTLTWEQVCDLVKKHIDENPDIFVSNVEIKRKLVQFELYMEDKNRGYDFETGQYYSHDRAKAVETTPCMEMRKTLKAIIDKYFDASNDEIGYEDEHKYFISGYFNIIGTILGIDCLTHGRCCNYDRDLPFIIGFQCKGGVDRYEASGEVIMITDEQKKNVDKILALIEEKAVFLINSDDCDSCT